MSMFQGILVFYKKLIAPTIVFSLLSGFVGLILFGTFSLKLVGVSYILMGLLLHYYIYDIRHPNAYYFFFNMGLGKSVLWMATLLIGILIGSILMSI